MLCQEYTRKEQTHLLFLALILKYMCRPTIVNFYSILWKHTVQAVIFARVLLSQISTLIYVYYFTAMKTLEKS